MEAEKMKTLEVVNHWYNDSGDAEIVLLKSLDKTRELKNDLFWYSGEERPMWSRGTQMTDSEMLATHCYKQRTFESIEQDIPDDCYMSLD
jgi:hypothetical protein